MSQLRWPVGALISGAVFSTSLVTITALFIAPSFAYMGYSSRETSTPEMVIAALSTLILVLLLPHRWRYPSHVAFSFLSATVGLPVILIPLYWGSLDTEQLTLLHLSTVGAFALARLLILGGRNPIRLPQVPTGVYWASLALLTVGSLLYVLLSTGISLRFLSLSDVYDQRSEYSSSVGGPAAYAVGWLSGGVLPAGLAAGMYLRSRSLIIGSIIGFLLLYSLSGFKSYLVGATLTIVAYFICKPKRRLGHQWMNAFSVAMLLAAGFDKLNGGFEFTTLIVRRALSTAGINTANYIVYFSHARTYELRHSVLSFLGPPPYSVSPARAVGTFFYYHDTAANANVLADGFANFGLIGYILAGVLVGVCLRGYDKLATGLPLQVAGPALTLVLVAAANTAFLTVLATHGGLIAAVAIALMPRSGWLAGNGRLRPLSSSPGTARMLSEPELI